MPDMELHDMPSKFRFQSFKPR